MENVASVAPAGVIGEGHFNHACAPMSYLATTLDTALLEIGALNEARIPILAVANSALVAAPRKDRGW